MYDEASQSKTDCLYRAGLCIAVGPGSAVHRRAWHRGTVDNAEKVAVKLEAIGMSVASLLETNGSVAQDYLRQRRNDADLTVVPEGHCDPGGGRGDEDL